MRPITESTVCLHASLLLLGGAMILPVSGCRAIRERREARAQEAAEQEQAQSNMTHQEWMASQGIGTQPPANNQPLPDPEPLGKPIYRQFDPANPADTQVVDERPSSQGEPAPMQASEQPIAQPVEAPKFAPKTREERSLAEAMTLRATGDLQAALVELERAIAYNPRFTPAFLEAGDIYMEMAQYDLAERQYAAAVQAEPRNFMAQYRHAVVLDRLGQLDDSRRAYLRALSIRPADFNANLGVSIVLLEMGDGAQSLPYAQRAVRNDPSSGRARLQLGNVYAAIDQHSDAVVEYQQAAELIDAPTAGLLLNMSESLNQLERYAEMVGTLEQLVRLEPSAIAYERLGSGLFRLKRYDESLEAFNSSVSMDDKHYPALNGVAVCELNNYLWSGKSDGASRERAVEAMRASLRIERKQPKIVELLRRYSRASSQER
ncbi:MAG: tetratricopeptide repeat protein [Phycisphaerales bacterium]|nr:tetratricopeptide repeat protein [Phycisphaerales bacterium]